MLLICVFCNEGACAAKGQYWLRRAQQTFYKPGVDMFAGDEDNGTTDTILYG